MDHIDSYKTKMFNSIIGNYLGNKSRRKKNVKYILVFITKIETFSNRNERCLIIETVYPCNWRLL